MCGGEIGLVPVAPLIREQFTIYRRPGVVKEGPTHPIHVASLPVHRKARNGRVERGGRSVSGPGGEIANLLRHVKRGTLRFWGEWFGRQYDNIHIVVSCDATIRRAWLSTRTGSHRSCRNR
jgi:hypothetical protein